MKNDTITTMQVKRTKKRQQFLEAVKQELGDVDLVSRVQVLEVMKTHGFSTPMWLTADKQHRADRGVYRIPDLVDSVVLAKNKEETPKNQDDGSVVSEVIGAEVVNHG